jgi:Mrr N-terminal domain
MSEQRPEPPRVGRYLAPSQVSVRVVLRSRPVRVPPVPVPDYQTLMRPVLALMEDGADWNASSIREAVVSEFRLTAEDIEERLPAAATPPFVTVSVGR